MEATYREDIQWIEEKLRLGLSVLVECDKQLGLHLYRAIRSRLRRATPPVRCALISGHSALSDEDGGGRVEDWEPAIDLGPNTGSFSTQATGLDPNTEYFFRARAENAMGASWNGTSLSFTTLVALPEFQFQYVMSAGAFTTQP